MIVGLIPVVLVRSDESRRSLPVSRGFGQSDHVDWPFHNNPRRACNRRNRRRQTSLSSEYTSWVSRAGVDG